MMDTLGHRRQLRGDQRPGGALVQAAEHFAVGGAGEETVASGPGYQGGGLEVAGNAPADAVIPVPMPGLRGLVRYQAVRRSQIMLDAVCVRWKYHAKLNRVKYVARMPVDRRIPAPSSAVW